MAVHLRVLRLPFVLVLLAFPAAGRAAAGEAAQPAGFEIGCRGWRTDLTFEGKIDKDYIPGSEITEGLLGFDNEQLVPVPYVRLGGLGNYFLVDYFQEGYEGTTVPSADITMSGTVFAAGTTVKSSLDLKVISGYYNYAFTDPNGSFQAGVIAGVKYFRIETDVESDTASASMRLVVPAPVAGTLMRMTLFEGMEITGMIAGLQLPESILGTKTFVLEALVEATAKMGYLNAGIGYHYYKGEFSANDGDDDEMEFDMKISGPYAVVSLVF
jgi:hypothetical protein